LWGLNGAAAADPTGEADKGALRFDFDRRLLLEFCGSKITSDAGLLAYRELDDMLRLTYTGAEILAQARTGKNGRHRLAGLLRPIGVRAAGRLRGRERRREVAPRPSEVLGGRAAPTMAISAVPVFTRCSCSNQFGDVERCALRSGNVHSADGWRAVLEPVIARYRGIVKRQYFRGDAAFAKPEMYEFLEAVGVGYTIRLPANNVLQGRIGYLLKRPVGRPPHEVRRFQASFTYQAQSWKKPRRVVAKVGWHPGELYPHVGFIVTNLARPTERVVAFYNQRGTAEQCIKEGKGAIKWTRLSCRTFAANVVRLQLHALAYNLGNFMRTLAMPKAAEPWSLTSLREKLIKIGAKVVSHGRYATFQLAEVTVSRQRFVDILMLIAGCGHHLRRREEHWADV
jgi:Transposase DDE domain group 1